MSENKDRSIHPYGRKGTNMMKQKRQTTIDRAMRGIEGHLERHPNDSYAKGYYDKLAKQTGI